MFGGGNISSVDAVGVEFDLLTVGLKKTVLLGQVSEKQQQ